MGNSAFFIPVFSYLLGIALWGMPFALTGLFIGRHRKSNIIEAFYQLSRESDASKIWTTVGILSILSTIVTIIFLFYALYIAHLTDAPALFFNSTMASDTPSVIELMRNSLNLVLLINLATFLAVIKYGSTLSNQSTLLGKALMINLIHTGIFCAFCLTLPISAATDFFMQIQTFWQILIPANGLFLCIFVGWIMKRKIAKKELNELGYTGFNIWYAFVRVLAPIGLLLLLAANLQNMM